LSAKATFWAWSLRGLTSSQKLVLLCLGDNHNGDTGRCDPSVNFIADKTGLNRKTVMQATSELEKIGLIGTQKRFGTSTNFTLKTGTEIGTSTENGPVPKTDTTSTENGLGPVPILGHKPKTEPKKNLKLLDFSSWPELPSEQIWTDYKQLRKIKKAPITQTVINAMGKEIKKLPHLTVDEILSECVSRGWQGFKADWILNTAGRNDFKKPQTSTKDRTLEQDLTDRSWAE